MVEISEVCSFWERNPLWSGESACEVGSVQFYNEHRKVYTPDLTEIALDLTGKGLDTYRLKADLRQQNAECMAYADVAFDHVNCQGVIYYPDAEATIHKVARVLKQGGTASISVYYRNTILKLWSSVRWIGWLPTKCGSGLKGGDREEMLLERAADEIVRLYDGSDNSIGKRYTRKRSVELIKRDFEIREINLHFLPTRSRSFRMPSFILRWLDRSSDYMVYATLEKPCVG